MSVATLKKGLSIIGVPHCRGALGVLPLGLVFKQILQDLQNFLISAVTPGQ